MTIRPYLATALAAFVLAGCTTLEERQRANGSFEYLETAETGRFAVPEGVDTPITNNAFTLPELGEEAQTTTYGEDIKVVSPALVLPLVSGSRVEEGSQEASIFFDQVDDSLPLDETIWNSLISFLEEQGIGVVSFDKENQTLMTDWMIIEEVEGSWYSWTKTERSVGRRFEFNLDVKSHGRSAALKAELRDYLETVNEEVSGDINEDQQRRTEVDVLNKVIGYYEQQIRIADIKRIRKIRRGIEMDLGFNPDGDAAYVVKGNYDIVWPRLLLVLRKLGFDVKDLDKSNGLLFVNYGSLDTSWWDDLFGDEEKSLDLKEAAYRLRVETVGDNTVVTLLNDENEPFEVDKVTELYSAFSRTMSDENLDI